MRSTLYNNSYFQKLLNNVQGSAHQALGGGDVNIVDMKKQKAAKVVVQQHNNSAEIAPMHISNHSQAMNNLSANIMIKTSYGNGGFGAANNPAQ